MAKITLSELLAQTDKQESAQKTEEITGKVHDALADGILKKVILAKGDKGDKGDMPQKGKDYLTSDDVQEVAKQAARYVKQGEDGRDGRDGKDIDEEKVIQKILKKVRVPKDGKNGKDGITYKAPMEEIKAIRDFVVEEIRKYRSDKEEAIKAINDFKEELSKKPEMNTVNTTGSVRSRRVTQWKIATYPRIAGTDALISAGDGVTYFLPDSCVPNSETGRINGGIPLSHGVDYTITGNKIVFQIDQTNSVQEWRWQVK